MRGRFRNGIFALITIGLMVVAAEFIAYAGRVLVGDDRFAPEPSRTEFLDKLQEQYSGENFDPDLGWITLKSNSGTDWRAHYS